jgi:hypothetical protein
MAYSATVTVKKVSSDTDFLVTIEETDATGTSEFEITDLPSTGRILRYTSVLTSGTGTTVDPIVGFATNPSGINVILENGTPAATIDVTPEPATYYVANKFFVRSKVDAGTNNSISTRILVRGTFGR